MYIHTVHVKMDTSKPRNKQIMSIKKNIYIYKSAWSRVNIYTRVHAHKTKNMFERERVSEWVCVCVCVSLLHTCLCVFLCCTHVCVCVWLSPCSYAQPPPPNNTLTCQAPVYHILLPTMHCHNWLNAMGLLFVRKWQYVCNTNTA